MTGPPAAVLARRRRQPQHPKPPGALPELGHDVDVRVVPLGLVRLVEHDAADGGLRDQIDGANRCLIYIMHARRKGESVSARHQRDGANRCLIHHACRVSLVVQQSCVHGAKASISAAPKR